MAVSVPQPEISGKRPPQNQEAEVSVLGAILLSEQALDSIQIDVKLRPDHFYRPRHGLIFTAMLRLKDKAEPEPVDVLTVCDELERAGQLEEVGGSEYVHSLPNLVPAAANARQYARIVREHAMLRGLLDTTRGIQEEVFGFAGEPHELLEKAEAQLYRIAHDDRTGELRSIEAVLHDELAKLERVSREGVSITGTPSGFKDIDDLTGGFQLVNGWNNLVDNNSGKTIGPNVTITYSKWTWVIDYYGGPENPDTNKGWRSLFDTTLTLTPSSKASVYLNYDYGQNRNVNGAGTATTNSATWKGFAGALRVQAAPKVAFVGRGEWFNDTDGFNTGVAQQVKEVTFTGEYKIIEGLLWRGEYRHDWSDQPFFLDHTPPVCIGALTTCVVTPFGVGNSKHQNTLTFAVIAFFGPKR